MDDVIRKRIEAVQRGEVPEGYQRTKEIGIAPKDWCVGKLSDVLHNEQRPVPRPTEPYWRLGIRSWAKGTFRTYVDDPASVDMDELFVVKERDLIVNITFAWEHAIAVAGKEDDGLLVSHRFPTYVFEKGNNPDFFRAVVSQSFFKEMLDNISPGGAGRNRVLNRKDFLQLPCYIPPAPEQQKISEILCACDKAVELKQKLVDELQSLKKTCLAKMFPRNDSIVPEVRFPGYNSPWEKFKLGDSVSFLSNNTFSRAELDYDSGAVKNIHYGDILTVFGDVLDISSTQLPYIPSASMINRFSESFLQDGDIVMADTAEDEAAGKCTEVYNSTNALILAGLHTIPMRPNRKYAPGFLGYYLNSPSYHDQLLPLMQGIKVTSVSKGAIQNTVVFFPSDMTEQAAIGRFFIHIDNLISLHQRELEATQQKKKALMQLLLTGLVRVND